MFLAIISDYNLRTGICELVDNALDLWLASGKRPGLKVDVQLNVERQMIRVSDNAGGVREEDARLLISPGASSIRDSHHVIGTFGVGGKRAGVALGEQVEIRSRFGRGKSIQVDITNDWLTSDDWHLDIYEIPDISPGTTSVDITKVRQGFNVADVDQLRLHLGETYSWFIKQGCEIRLEGQPVEAILFDNWAYPPDYRPRIATFEISPADDKKLTATLRAGLIRDRVPEAENYGIYVYCNNRLIVKELRTRDVGYFISSEAGVPHPDASLCRAIIEFFGPPEVMPWNSSKSDLNHNHPAFTQIRPRLINFVSYFSSLSRRLKHNWDNDVFSYKKGEMEVVDPIEALSTKRTVLPKLPRTRKLARVDQLRASNKRAMDTKPWTIGLVEAMGLIEVISKQKLETKNRVALILLDSNLEIALKEFIVSRTDLFPPHKYTDSKILEIFARRFIVIKEVTAHVPIKKDIQDKISHYYNLRNKLVHERATVGITDLQIDDYRKTVEFILRALFDLKFPAP
ncbi:ATP-binding protein [Ralstonia solanacearum]|uniref:Histidine kinase n=1 Tax=Ralstonia solanacearum TaxID=305 RepID=A0AAD0WGR4_RALSL|nr:ATP-binding protein [Ralstonia solanacearum]AXV82234.1 histidine kinase [Ralstonia solanacearum]AXW53362.1 histidine kinase [Ralstonia solanacearum]